MDMPSDMESRDPHMMPNSAITSQGSLGKQPHL